VIKAFFLACFGFCLTSPAFAQEIPIYDEYIDITPESSQTFIAFLRENDRKVIFVNSEIRLGTLTLGMDWAGETMCGWDRPDNAPMNGYIFNQPLVFPAPDPIFCNRYSPLVFIESDRDIARPNHAGTNTLSLELMGFFLIGRRARESGNVTYYLTEIDADAALWAEMLNR